MAPTYVSLMTLTLRASAALQPKRFVTWTGAQAGAGGNAAGIARTAAAAGEDVAVDVIGTAIAEAGAAIAIGDAVESDADGRAVPAAAGDGVEIVLIPN